MRVIDNPGDRSRRVAAVALLFWTVVAPAVAATADPESRRLGIEEAIAMALENNEGIVIERVATDSAEAALDGAGGAYDPVLDLETGWRRRSVPADSAFSGAPEGEAAPTDEAFEAAVALTRLLPTGGALSLRAGAARRESDDAFRLLSPAWDSRLGVELRQPLARDRAVDGVRLRLRVATAERDRAVASLHREVVATVAAVEAAYWDLLAARRAVEVRREAVLLAAEQLEETGIRIEGGAAPETEAAQPRAELERRRGELLAAEERASRAENRLKLLVLGDADGAAWAARLVPVEAPVASAPAVDLAAALAGALASRPELAAVEAVVTRRRAETAFARDGLLPAVDLVVSWDRFGLAGSRNRAAEGVPDLPGELPPALEGGFGDSLEQLADGDFDDARVAVVFELPLGNRAARASARIAANAERQAEAELARVRKQVRAEVLDAASSIDTAAGRVDAARAARQAAEIQLAAERDRYAAGLSTNFLVLTRQNDLADARLAEIEAATDLRAARTEMDRATGALLAARGIELALASR